MRRKEIIPQMIRAKFTSLCKVILISVLTSPHRQALENWKQQPQLPISLDKSMSFFLSFDIIPAVSSHCGLFGTELGFDASTNQSNLSGAAEFDASAFVHGFLPVFSPPNTPWVLFNHGACKCELSIVQCYSGYYAVSYIWLNLLAIVTTCQKPLWSRGLPDKLLPGKQAIWEIFTWNKILSPGTISCCFFLHMKCQDAVEE